MIPPKRNRYSEGSCFKVHMLQNALVSKCVCCKVRVLQIASSNIMDEDYIGTFSIIHSLNLVLKFTRFFSSLSVVGRVLDTSTVIEDQLCFVISSLLG